jgi:hypothetical protein
MLALAKYAAKNAHVWDINWTCLGFCEWRNTNRNNPIRVASTKEAKESAPIVAFMQVLGKLRECKHCLTIASSVQLLFKCTFRIISSHSLFSKTLAGILKTSQEHLTIILKVRELVLSFQLIYLKLMLNSLKFFRNKSLANTGRALKWKAELKKIAVLNFTICRNGPCLFLYYFCLIKNHNLSTWSSMEAKAGTGIIKLYTAIIVAVS